jgi:hypothetical protein
LIERVKNPKGFIPFSGGARVAMDLAFVIMGFADPADPDVVCMGYPTGVLWIEDMAEVHRYKMLFHHLQASALSLDDSAAIGISVLTEM